MGGVEFEEPELPAEGTSPADQMSAEERQALELKEWKARQPRRFFSPLLKETSMLNFPNRDRYLFAV